MGDHSAKTFEPLWELFGGWKCYFYATDRWLVYPMFIPVSRDRDRQIE